MRVLLHKKQKMNQEKLSSDLERTEGAHDPSELNDARDATLYGNLPGSGSGNEPSSAMLKKAEETASEHGRSMDQDPNRPNEYETVVKSLGEHDFIVHSLKKEESNDRPELPLKIVDYPPQSINLPGVTGIHQRRLIEVAPGRLETQIINILYSGSEEMLREDVRTGRFNATPEDVRIKEILLTDQNIDPEKQKDLRQSGVNNTADIAASATADDYTLAA